jgi:hypothetical protein
MYVCLLVCLVVLLAFSLYFMLSASVVSFLFPFVVFPCLCYYFGLFWVCSHSSGNDVRTARVKLLEASNWQNAVIAWIWRLCVFHVCVLSSILISCCLSHVICISTDVSYLSLRFCVDSLGSPLLILANCLMFSPCTEFLSWWKLEGNASSLDCDWEW